MPSGEVTGDVTTHARAHNVDPEKPLSCWHDQLHQTWTPAALSPGATHALTPPDYTRDGGAADSQL
jgi:hypothetical protein